jgi:uncharacterized protein YjlB
MSESGGGRIETAVFDDDGLLPNSRLAVLLYRGAVRPDISDPADAFEKCFAENDWTASWRAGVYPFHHYHSTSHEVLGIAAGSGVLRLGGREGRDIGVSAGDVIVLPAGTGHMRVEAAPDFLVVGAYPEGRDWDLIRPYETTKAIHDAALTRIAAVPLPKLDPVSGAAGPLPGLWAQR